MSSSLSCLDLVFGFDFDLVFFDLDRYSSSYSANSSSRDFFLGRAGLSLLRDFGVSSVGSLAVPHEPQNFDVDLSSCPQLSQNAIFYCFAPHLPQNFAVGFSGLPQLLQDEDVGLVSAGFGLGL